MISHIGGHAFCDGYSNLRSHHVFTISASAGFDAEPPNINKTVGIQALPSGIDMGGWRMLLR
jgi:hypothetical protein